MRAREWGSMHWREGLGQLPHFRTTTLVFLMSVSGRTHPHHSPARACDSSALRRSNCVFRIKRSVFPPLRPDEKTRTSFNLPQILCIVLNKRNWPMCSLHENTSRGKGHTGWRSRRPWALPCRQTHTGPATAPSSTGRSHPRYCGLCAGGTRAEETRKE